MTDTKMGERIADIHVGIRSKIDTSAPLPGYFLFSRSRRFLGRLSIPNAIAVITGFALFEAVAFHQIIWRLHHGGSLPLDLVGEIAIVTILVAAPIIAYSQDIIRAYRRSRRALRTTTQELADARDTLERKVALRTLELSAANKALSRTVADLQVARDQAQAANNTKSQFLANMSHELRTPLNAIIGFSQVIRDDTLGIQVSARYRDYASDIHNSGEHLLRIIENILDMSKIEAKKITLEEQALEVTPVINAALRLIEQAASDMRITICAHVPEGLPQLLADEMRLKQVLINLLSNAVKFSHSPGTVNITATLREDCSLAIQVSDTGIGMSDKEIEIAFEPFRQIESVNSRRHHGTGLGLPLARELTELHGGSLNLVSAPGLGTTATVAFPAARTVKRTTDTASGLSDYPARD